jgi:hypothetical protein
MNTSVVYVPIVKGKKFDLMAAGGVLNDVRRVTKPFIEAMPVNPLQPSIEEHVHKLCSQIKKYLPLGSIFVDFYGLMPDATVTDGTNATVHGFRLLKALGRSVTPAYGLERNDAIWGDLGQIARAFGNGFCFRLSREDLVEYAFDDVWSQIIERSAEMGVASGEIDLLLDMRHIDGEDLPSLSENITSFLFHNPGVSEYRSVIVAGSSALKSVGEIEKDGTEEVVRQELRLWSSLWVDMPDNFKPTFGDYGIIHPDFSDQTPNKNVNAKIRYTVGDKIIYFRGHALHVPTNDYEQYHEIAGRVRSDSRYAGRPESVGDRYIDDCASHRVSPGSLGTWVKVDMNHHICYTARQLVRVTKVLVASESEQALESVLATA